MDKRIFLFTKALKSRHYKISETMVHRLLSDPDNIVLSITNTLDFFKIKYLVANVPKSAIKKLQGGFIAQVQKGNLSELVYVQMKGEELRIHINENVFKDVNIETFLDNWTGFIIMIEDNPIKHSVWNLALLRKYTPLLMGALISLMYVFLSTSSILSLIYFLCSGVGMFLSIMILKQKVGAGYEDSRFCSFSTKTSCRKVLLSSSVVFWNIDFVDLCMVYFSFCLGFFLMFPNSVVSLLLVLFSLPIIPYSLYIQKNKIKSWCPLCIGVSIILILQSIVLVLRPVQFSIDLVEIICSLVVVLVATGSWILIKPYFYHQRKNQELMIENLRFRRDYRLFIPYFYTLPVLNLAYDSLNAISIGTSGADLHLTVITNPQCKNCADAHKLIHEIYKKYRNNIYIDFRFLVPYNMNNIDYLVSQRLMEINEAALEKEFLEAYNHWFETQTELWFHTWGYPKDDAKGQELKSHTKWCLDNDIASTPRMILNGRLIPDVYHYKDIEIFIEAITTQLDQGIVYENETIIHA